MRAALLGAVLALALTGCVTESTGAPEPASKEARVQAQINLARGYLDSDDPSRARVPLERALEIDAGSADALGLFAVFYQRDEELELAEQYYRRAMRADPDHPANLNNYAALLYSQGRYKEALGPLQRLVAITSYRGRAMAFENLGLTQLRLGDTEAARNAFRRALSLNPDLSASNLETADLAYRDGDYPTAARHYDVFRARAAVAAEPLSRHQSGSRPGRSGPARELRDRAQEPVPRIPRSPPVHRWRLSRDQNRD